MDNWGTEEKKNNSDIARKILLAIIALLVIIIVIIIILISQIKTNTYRVLIDGKEITEVSNLIKTSDNTTYINIQELAKLLKYEYHAGEYKEFSSSKDKCYIQSVNETASFYLNSNKVCKLKVNNLKEDYDVFNCDKNIIAIQEQLYAPVDAIKVGFNVKVQESTNGMVITTLNKLITNYDTNLNSKEPIYKSLSEQDLDNQKAVLYGYIILNKKDTNLYGVISTSGQELLSNRFTSIKFIETSKEFIVTNSLGKMGIVDAEGNNKVEQLYDNIKIINNNPKLYLVEVNKKFGVVDENGGTIVYPEYDKIGIDVTKYKNVQNQYILLDEVIPVGKNGKYGLFNISGNKVLDVIYDGIGCELISVEINKIAKTVNPEVAIEECDGIIVKSGEKYGLFSKSGKEMVPTQVTAIYSINNSGVSTYYMLYNDEEINLIQRLIEAKVIEGQNYKNENENKTNNIVSNNIVTNFNVPID